MPNSTLAASWVRKRYGWGRLGGQCSNLTCARLWFGRAQVGREPPPPLPGGWKLKDLVYYTGKSQTFPSGNKLVHGQQGEVMGPGTDFGEKTRVAVLFPGNKNFIQQTLISK